MHEISWGDLLSSGERSDALAGLLRGEHQDPIVAGSPSETTVVEQAKEREHMLATRAGKVAGARDRDRALRGELAHNGFGKARDRVRQKDGLRPDADEIATLGESRDDLPIESVVRLQHGGGRRLQRLPPARGARARPPRPPPPGGGRR